MPSKAIQIFRLHEGCGVGTDRGPPRSRRAGRHTKYEQEIAENYLQTSDPLHVTKPSRHGQIQAHVERDGTFAFLV
jgi:hypothetical protein